MERGSNRAMNADAIRNAIAAAGIVMTLGAGIISVKVDIAKLDTTVATLQTTIGEMKSVIRELERGSRATSFPL